MSLLTELGDREFWEKALKDDEALRECVKQVTEIVDVEISLPDLQLSIDLSAQISTRITDLQVERQAILDEIPCIQVIINALESSLDQEAIDFRSQMIARLEAKEQLAAELEAQISSLEPQVELFSTTNQTLEVNSKNATFLGGIIDDIESGAC